MNDTQKGTTDVQNKQAGEKERGNKASRGGTRANKGWMEERKMNGNQESGNERQGEDREER